MPLFSSPPPLAPQDLQDMITNKGKGRADLTNLPRKINVCVSPSRDDFPHTQVGTAAGGAGGGCDLS